MKNIRKKDLRENNLKGNIKSIKTIKQNFVVNAGQLSRNGDYNQDEKVFEIYNQKGNLINSLTYDSGNKMTLNLICQYDINGKRTGGNLYCFDNSLISVSTYHYSGNNTIVHKTDDTETIYKYNPKGYLIEELTYDTKGELQVKYTYEYDKNENEIECIHHDNFCFSKITYKYDGQGNLIREKSYCPDGSNCEEKIFEYEFDQNKNWIKKIEMSTKNTCLRIITNRKINYN